MDKSGDQHIASGHLSVRSTREWVAFLRFMSKLIFRVYMVGREDLGNLGTGGSDLEYCKTFFDAVKSVDGSHFSL